MSIHRAWIPTVEREIESALFALRVPVLIALALATAFCVRSALDIRLDASLEKQLPQGHPFIQTALAYRDKIPGLNKIQIAVETKSGDIWNQPFLKTLDDVTQEVFFLPGIARSSVASMWTPNTRVIESTEGAVEARDLIPGTLTAATLTPADIEKIKQDAFRGGFRGKLFSFDGRAALINAAVQDSDAKSGAPTDLFAVAAALEQKLRKKFEHGGITIRMIGFAPFIGQIADEARQAFIFLGIAFTVITLAVWFYARSIRLTALAVLSSLASVIWLLGLLPVLGWSLSPLGLIVPFLTYAIGVSHGVQQIHQFMAARLNGSDEEEAARIAFRVLLAPGGFALGTCAGGFLALTYVPIPLVRELAFIAALGIALKLVSNLIMLPLMASLLRFSPKQLSRQNKLAASRDRFVRRIAAEAHPLPAFVIVALAAGLTVFAWTQAERRSIGDLSAGAPELWPSARYNVDSAAIAKAFDVNLDLFVTVIEAPKDSCIQYPVMHAVEAFGIAMRETPGVKSIVSLPEASRLIYAIVQEGNLKWRVLAKDPQTLALTTGFVPTETGLLNKDCTLLTVGVYLEDHFDATLRRVTATAQRFIAENKTEGVSFKLATGNAGILAAMNDTIATAEWPAMGLSLLAAALLVFAAFLDWRAVISCCTPLVMATIFGHWLMTELGLGLKISTLPVLVIASGIGVDYAFYLHNRLMAHLHAGAGVETAYIEAMREKGVAVMFTGLVLAAGAGVWAFSGLKFQADMGLLLAFMFLVNMILSVTVLPALTVLLDLIAPRRAVQREVSR